MIAVKEERVYTAAAYVHQSVESQVWGSGGGTGAGTPGAASPFLIDLDSYNVAAGLVLDGSGDYASAPHSARLNVTGDLDIRIDVAVADRSPATFQGLVSRYENATPHFFLSITTAAGHAYEARFECWNSSGTRVVDAYSTGAIWPFADGERGWVRVTLDADNGSGQHVVKFFKSTDDGATWTQFGSTTTGAGAVTLASPTVPLRIGALDGTSGYTTGTIYEVQVRNGIDGPLVANPKFEGAHLAGGVTSLTDRQGNTWTLSGNASIASGPAKQVLWSPGASGNYASIPDTNLLDTRQASFDNVGVDPLINPEDRYEVWGSGGGTGAGAPGSTSPFLIDLEDYDVAAGLVLDGSGDYASAPHHARLNVTGDLDIRAKLAATDWNPASRSGIAGKWDPNSYVLTLETGGQIALFWQEGGFLRSATSTVAVGATDGSMRWVRATLDVNNGAATPVYEVKFYTSTDGEAWTQLGTTVSGPTTTYISVTSSVVSVGATGTASQFLAGTIYEVQVRNGINGPLVANPRFEGSHIAGGVTSFRDGQGNTWTLNGNASIASGNPSQVGWLPGASGNYFSEPDTNLLDATSAHLHQHATGALTANNSGIVGQWTARQVTGSLETGRSGVPVSGDRSVRVVHGGTYQSDWGAIARVEGIVAGQEYTFGGWVKPDAGSVARLSIRFLDSGGATLSSVVSATTTDDTEWTKLSISGTAPTNTSRLLVVLQGTNINHAVEGAGFVLRTGSSATFLPSHRIVGDLDLRARVAAKMWAGGGSRDLVCDWGPRYWWGVNTNGRPFISYLDSGNTQRTVTCGSAVPGTNRQPLFLRVVIDVDNGAAGHDVKFYTSIDGVAWTQLGATVTTAGIIALRNGAAALKIGSRDGTSDPFLGTFLYAEVRDGIDGPVVASLDTTTMLSPSTTTDTSPEGHTVTLNRSGNATAEIVDRDSWAFTGSETMGLPDRNEWDLTVDQSLAVAASTFLRNSATYGGIFKKFSFTGESTSGHEGWSLRVVPPNVQARMYTHAGSWGDKTVAYTTGAWNQMVFSMDRTADSGVFGVGGTEVTGALPTTGDLTHTDGVVIGRNDVGGTAHFTGLSRWYAFFRRALTAAERTALYNWDGSISSEPTWLRSLAVFYTNANDPHVKTSYTNNEVLNLATLPYGDLGWQMYKGAELVRYSGIIPVVGSMTIRWRTHGTETGSVLASAPVGPVTPGQTYSASYSVATSSGGSRETTPVLVWFDEDEGEIGRSVGVEQAGIPTSWSGWTRHSVEGVAPAGAAKVGVEIQSNDINVYFAFDAIIIRQGSDTGYVPSLRIREDIDVRARVALKDWTPSASTSAIIAKDAGTGSDRSYALAVLSNGLLRLSWAEDGSTLKTVSSSVAPTVADRGVLWIRATLDVDNGASGHDVKFYTSTDGSTWTQLGSTQTVAGTTSIYVGSAGLALGAFTGGTIGNTTGTFLYAEVRDGIDGPVVTSAEFSDPAVVDGDVSTTAEGHTVTLNRSGNATAEIVDRDCVAHTDTERFEVPDRDALDFAAGESLAIAAGTQSRSTSSRNLVRKSTSAAHAAGGESAGYILGNSGSRLFGVVRDGTSGSSHAVDGYLDGSWNVATMNWDSDSLDMRYDGVAGSAVGSPRDARNASPLYIGSSLGHIGLWSWVAILRRVLTSTEITELEAWDGTVSSEPSWLRAAAVFYWNANDPDAKTKYQTNEVVNLATSAATDKVTLAIDWYSSAPALISSSTGTQIDTVGSDWVRPYVTATSPTGAVSAKLRVVFDEAESGDVVRIDAVLMEQTEHLREYFDGAKGGADYLWSGTAHASQSHYYGNRAAKNSRLGTVLPDFLPPDRDHRLEYANEV